MADVEGVKQCLGKLIDPEIGRSFADLRMIGAVSSTDTGCEVELVLPTPAYPDRQRLVVLAQQAAAAAGVPAEQLKVRFTVQVRGKESGGAIGLRVKNIIAVGSGKGGVGKSTVAASLACGLVQLGARVGLLDADVYGPSIPHMLGVSGAPAIGHATTADGSTVERILPILAGNLRVMSIGFLVGEDQAVIWRGPMLHKLLTQFLRDTDWGELDYLIIDLPPGTGDVSLTLSQMLGLAGAVVVCTPQKVALLDAVKAVNMFRKLEIPVLGMVENMSGEVFGRGGVRAKAAELGVPCLGEIPIDSGIRELGDEGRIADVFADSHPSREPLLLVVEQIGMEAARQLLKQPRLPTFEIL